MHQTTIEQAAAGDGHSIAEAKKHMRTYAIVGVALAIGTGLTVWAAFINFGSWEINIIAALIIASTKGFLVAGFFMHLISEKKLIYSVMVCTVFFFAALMFLTLMSMQHDNIVHMR
jgi:caa(3)-type oxidase subunit IV